MTSIGNSDGASSAGKWVLPATILGSSLGFIDSSVVNVALTNIQMALGTSLASIQWVTNGYLLTLASLILLGGAIGDRYGTLRAFQLGMAAFTAASVACGLSPSAEALIVARLVQGGAAAVLMPTSLALLSQTYRGEARGKAIGTWAATGGVLMAFGPPLGGWLVEAAGWRSIFIINVPVAALALVLTTLIARDDVSKTARSIDLPGATCAVVALGLLTYGLIELGQGDRAGLVSIAASVPIMAVFIAIEYFSANPMMPLNLFSNRTFAGANALTVVLYGALGGAIFLLPYSLIKAHGYRPVEAGVAFLPLSLILGLGSRAAGGLADRIGNRIPLMVGPLIAAAGFAVLAVCADLQNYWSAFLPGLVLVGTGMTLVVPALTTAVFNAAPDIQSGAASGINNAAARTGGLLATAALGIAFDSGNASGLSGGQILDAYKLVMWTAATASVVSALIAHLTIGGQRKSV
jgi:EmrB/QacA subfamily drug resistance transporter